MPEEVVAARRDVEPTPEEAARALAPRRLEVTREALAEAGGINPQRLQGKDGAVALGESREGHVEFAIAQ